MSPITRKLVFRVFDGVGLNVGLYKSPSIKANSYIIKKIIYINDTFYFVCFSSPGLKKEEYQCYQRWVKNIIGTGLGSLQPTRSCADPNSFVRGGPTLQLRQRFFFLFTFVDEGREMRIQMPLKVGHHRPASETILGRHWRLGGFVIFQGIRTSIAIKRYRFVIFRGGGGQDPCPPPPPLDPWYNRLCEYRGIIWFIVLCFS